MIEPGPAERYARARGGAAGPEHPHHRRVRGIPAIRPSTPSRWRGAAPSRRAAACSSPRPPAPARRSSASSPCTSRCASRGDKAFYTTPMKALSNQKFRELAGRLRRRRGRPADRRHEHQRQRAHRRHDDRGAAQHALRRLSGAARAPLRRDGRGALPRRPLPRRGVGGDHHPPARRACGWSRCRRPCPTPRSSATGSTPCAATPR